VWTTTLSPTWVLNLVAGGCFIYYKAKLKSESRVGISDSLAIPDRVRRSRGAEAGVIVRARKISFLKRGHLAARRACTVGGNLCRHESLRWERQ